jgi:hypothetical protein
MRVMMHRIALAALVAGFGAGGVGGALLAGEAPADRVLLQPPPDVIASPINDRFAVRMLYYRPAIDNTLRYDSAAGVPGTDIDVEDILGHRDSAHHGTIDLMFRIGERHRIHADFYQLRRTGDEVISGEIRFGDDVFLANDRVLSEMELRKLGLAYTYSLFRREKFELGLGLALHLLQLQGEARVPARFVSEQLDTAGPFAALASHVTWRVTRRFSLNASAQYLDLNPDDIRGAFRGFHAHVPYRGWRNLAFCVGYTYSGYLVDSTDADFFAGSYRLEYQGPEAFLRVSF